MAEFLDHQLKMRGAAILLAALIALPSASCVGESTAEQARGEGTVTVTNLSTPGKFEVRNSDTAEALLSREVIVEQEAGGRWAQVVVPFELVENCDGNQPKACIKLPAGATLQPVAWNGFSCAPQCPGSCRANVYLGPGTFRFVVSTCDQKRRFTGPSFTLTAEHQ